MNHSIAITAFSGVSSLGYQKEDIWRNYQEDSHFFKKYPQLENQFVAKILMENEELLKSIKINQKNYEKLDRTALLALFCASRLEEIEKIKDKKVGVNISSSRGATELWETYHTQSLKKEKFTLLASPTTSLGTISSWVGNYLQLNGIRFSHSMTCSSALIAILNGIAWLNSDMCEAMIVGGSEAPLTPFTLNQMNALKIYAHSESRYPCQAGNLDKKENTMILGEGAGLCLLEKNPTGKSLAYVKGFGFGTEIIPHATSLSENAENLQQAMNQIFDKIPKESVDVIITHTPGTLKGDQAELRAIQSVFGENLPYILNNKWKIGHTFGASGMMSLELALLILEHQELPFFPFEIHQNKPIFIRNILINSMGFGGNAISILVGK